MPKSWAVCFCGLPARTSEIARARNLAQPDRHEARLSAILSGCQLVTKSRTQAVGQVKLSPSVQQTRAPCSRALTRHRYLTKSRKRFSEPKLPGKPPRPHTTRLPASSTTPRKSCNEPLDDTGAPGAVGRARHRSTPQNVSALDGTSDDPASKLTLQKLL